MAQSTDFSISAILGWQPSTAPSNDNLNKMREASLGKSASTETKSGQEEVDDADVVWLPSSWSETDNDDNNRGHDGGDEDCKLDVVDSISEHDSFADSTSTRLMPSTVLQQPSSPTFPIWTQRQRRGGGGIGRRPYSRGCVLALGWWYSHLPYLATDEMEALGRLTALSRHQIKVWWQNRRHSQRHSSGNSSRRRRSQQQNCNSIYQSVVEREEDAASSFSQLPSCQLSPPLLSPVLPPPQSYQRRQLFGRLFRFFCLHVMPLLPPLTGSFWRL